MLKVKRILNDNKYNEIDIEKSNIFLDNLQQFVIDIGLVNESDCDSKEDERSYDLKTYYFLYYEDLIDDDSIMKKRDIKQFQDGTVQRYFNDNIELLIIFLLDKIKLIFYCKEGNRKIIIDSMMKFCEFKNVK